MTPTQALPCFTASIAYSTWRAGVEGGVIIWPMPSISSQDSHLRHPSPRLLRAISTQSMPFLQNTFPKLADFLSTPRAGGSRDTLYIPPNLPSPATVESNFHPQGLVPATQNSRMLPWASFFFPGGARGSSTWCRRPCGDQVVTSVSYWFLNIVQVIRPLRNPPPPKSPGVLPRTGSAQSIECR